MATRATTPETTSTEGAARDERLKLLGQIIKSSRGERTQIQLGELLGEITGVEVPQTTISRWEKGMVELSVEQVRDIEIALGLEPGAILVGAGYVAPTTSDVVAVLRSDPKLHANFRDDLVRVYLTYVDSSRRMAEMQVRGPQANGKVRGRLK